MRRACTIEKATDAKEQQKTITIDLSNDNDVEMIELIEPKQKCNIKIYTDYTQTISFSIEFFVIVISTFV